MHQDANFRHLSRSPFCPECHKPFQPDSHSCTCSSHHSNSRPSPLHHSHRNGEHTCKHPVIFDKRFIIDEHFSDQCHGGFPDDCSCGRICLCDNQFRIRLAGLQGGMSFRLRQLIDCEVVLEIEQAESSSTISARICMVGSDFVEVQELKKVVKPRKPVRRLMRNQKAKKAKCTSKKLTFRVIPFDSIKSITFKETDYC